jgi:hypothetical protein
MRISSARITTKIPLTVRAAGTFGVVALTSFALALGPIAPAHADEAVPQTDKEAQQLAEDRAPDDASSLDRDSVPEDLNRTFAGKDPINSCWRL